jgi:hypothetical protein
MIYPEKNNPDSLTGFAELFFVVCYNQKMSETKAITPIEKVPVSKEEEKVTRGIRVWLIVVVAAVLLALLSLAVFFLFKAPAAVTTQIRDIFIIFMALEFMILGIALVILIIQLAKLVNLLQNEVKPILDATTETVNTLRGTTEFLSENLVEPVINVTGYMAGVKKVFDLLKIVRK